MAFIYTPVPIKRSSKYGNNYWVTYSPKLNRNVRLFSDLEYDHWVLMETNPDVISFCEQPFEIEYFIEGKNAKSIPDMWVQYKNGSKHLVEVKYSKELMPESKNYEKAARQISIQRAYCNENGFTHYVHTEKDIRGNDILLSNMKMIIPYIKNREYTIDTDCKRVLDIIYSNHNRILTGTIHAAIKDIHQVRVRESIFRLLYQGIIFGNLDKIPYSNNTEVWLNDYKEGKQTH